MSHLLELKVSTLTPKEAVQLTAGCCPPDEPIDPPPPTNSAQSTGGNIGLG